jgi:hypothetical protein
MNTSAWTLVLALVTLGCSVEPAREESLIEHPDTVTNSPEGVEPDNANIAPSLVANAKAVPVSGGTLLVTRDGLWAVAADPDRDRVSIVGLSQEVPNCSACLYGPALVYTVELEPGDEPGRLVEDGAGRVHVALRRGGAIATIDLATGQLLARRFVCGSPRGVAYDAGTELLHVACASGELVSLPAYGGEPVRRLTLDVDLRDVIVQPNGLVVSRFKSAELLLLDTDGNLVARIEPAGIERISQDASPETNDPIEPAVAWRTIAKSGGGVLVLHQYALARAIGPEDPAGATTASADVLHDSTEQLRRSRASRRQHPQFGGAASHGDAHRRAHAHGGRGGIPRRYVGSARTRRNGQRARGGGRHARLVG